MKPQNHNVFGAIALASVAWMMTPALSPLAATSGTSSVTEIVDPFKNYTSSLAPAGSASLAPVLGLTTHYTNNDAALDAAKVAGFTWIRKDIIWQDVETSKGVYDWSAYDNLASALDSRDMKPLWVLCYSNSLYAGGIMNGPSTDAERTGFGNYAEAAARHFAGHGARWEIWNEPDGSTFWLPSPNAREYAALAKSVLPRVRAGDPTALVTTGGLGMFDYAFLRDMLAAGVGNGFDAIGVHPYWLDGDPETVFDKLQEWQSIKNQYSVGVLPNWNTEFGYDVNGDSGGGNLGGDQAKYAAWTARLILSCWAAGFKMIIIYDTDDGGHGLLNPPNRPGYQAVRTLSTAAEGRDFTSFNIPTDNTLLNALRLEGPCDVVEVLWMRSGQTTVQVPQGTTVLDMLGKPLTLRGMKKHASHHRRPSGTHLSLTIDAAAGPVYLTFPK